MNWIIYAYLLLKSSGGGWHSNSSDYVCQLANLSDERMISRNGLLKVMARDTINVAASIIIFLW